MENSFSFKSKSCFLSPVWLWGVRVCNVIGMLKRKTQITNYVVDCILLKGFFLMSLLALHAASQFLPYSPLFLYAKVIQYPCSLHLPLSHSFCFSLLSPSSLPKFTPFSLALFIRLTVSLLPSPPVRLSEKISLSWHSLLVPPQAPCSFSTLFFSSTSSPPPPPRLH